MIRTKAPLQDFTVVVLYPNSRMDTYVASVKAQDAYQARKVGSKQAMMKQPSGARGKLKDWNALVVFKGVHDVQAWGWQA